MAEGGESIEMSSLRRVELRDERQEDTVQINMPALPTVRRRTIFGNIFRPAYSIIEDDGTIDILDWHRARLDLRVEGYMQTNIGAIPYYTIKDAGQGGVSRGENIRRFGRYGVLQIRTPSEGDDRVRPPPYQAQNIEPRPSTSSYQEPPIIQIQEGGNEAVIDENLPPAVVLLVPEQPLHYVLAYNMGLFFRNVSLTIWESYMMVFLTLVIQTTKLNAALFMIAGLFVNIFATNIVRYWKTSALKKHWIGVFLAVLSFIPMFTPYPEYYKNDYTLMWYGSCMVVFQFGCAFMELSHLLETPFLAGSQFLTFHRLFSECLSKASAYLFVLIAFVIIDIFYPKISSSSNITEDKYALMVGAVFITVLGFISFLIFRMMIHNFTEWQKEDVNLIPNNIFCARRFDTTARHRYSHALVSFMYVFVRILLLLVTIYFPMSISEREVQASLMDFEKQFNNPEVPVGPLGQPPLRLSNTLGIRTADLRSTTTTTAMSPLVTAYTSRFVYDIFIIPLLMWLSATVGGILYNNIISSITRMQLFSLALFPGLASGIYMYFIQPASSSVHLYIISILFGLSCSVCLFTSADLVYITMEICHDDLEPSSVTDIPLRYGIQTIVSCIILLLIWLHTTFEIPYLNIMCYLTIIFPVCGLLSLYVLSKISRDNRPRAD